MKLRLDLRLSQKLIMTPQLQQAIKLLQLSRLELQQTLTQHLMENPLLEELPPDVDEASEEATQEKTEPERQCPNCLKPLKLYVQVCPRCGTDLYLPDPAEVRHPGVR